jgi:hypothetical protein
LLLKYLSSQNNKNGMSEKGKRHRKRSKSLSDIKQKLWKNVKMSVAMFPEFSVVQNETQNDDDLSYTIRWQNRPEDCLHQSVKVDDDPSFLVALHESHETAVLTIQASVISQQSRGTLLTESEFMKEEKK